MSSNWWSIGQSVLERRAQAECKVQMTEHLKKGKSRKTFRYHPPQWHRDAVEALGRNDEEIFKLVMLDAVSVLGVPW